MPSQKSDKLQLNEHGRLRHFLTIEGLSRELLLQILDTAESFADPAGPAGEKGPAAARAHHHQSLFREQHAHPDHL